MLWSELKTVAQGFLHRSDVNLDGLQPLAIADISAMLVVQEIEGVGSMTLAADDNLWFAPLPVDYARIRSVDVSGVTCDPVDYKTLKELRNRNRSAALYAITGNRIYTHLSGTAAIVYTKRLVPGENVVLERYPNVYLYALLKHAAIYVQDFDAQQQYQAQFEQQCEVANSVYLSAAFGPGMTAVPVGGML